MRRQFVQLITVPPPTPVPATIETWPSAVGNGPAVQVHALVGGELEAVEVGVVVVVAGLEHDHRLAGRRPARRRSRRRPRPSRRRRRRPRSSPRARCGRRTRSGRSRSAGGGAIGPGKPIASQLGLRPGAEVGQRRRRSCRRCRAGSRSPPAPRGLGLAEAVDDLLARLLRRRGAPSRSRPASRAARRSPAICSSASPACRSATSTPSGTAMCEAARRQKPRVGLVALGRLERGDEGVAERRQRRPLGVVEEVAGRERGERLADRLADRGAVGEVVRVADGRVARR